ncbi:hypothetical protein MPH_01556 [Macrophomina phaseolina MS6]|uniref:Uncharacterized protein n=1 Tax=Macrophomina phaseolina (strain MS6) TaxID=1126212 RepID=K2S898_MACPH|nr:hypothetical protein MPH_01556 [Macrophomina phaseolina MS6]
MFTGCSALVRMMCSLFPSGRLLWWPCTRSQLEGELERERVFFLSLPRKDGPLSALGELSVWVRLEVEITYVFAHHSPQRPEDVVLFSETAACFELRRPVIGGPVPRERKCRHAGTSAEQQEEEGEEEVKMFCTGQQNRPPSSLSCFCKS